MKAFAIAVITLVLGGQLAAAQWLKQPTAGIPRTPDGKPNLVAPAPRTTDGKPDLSGLWLKNSPKYARNIAADLAPDEILPWARTLLEQRREDLGKDGMQVRCLPLGPAYATSGDSTGSEMTRIVQTPPLIVMLPGPPMVEWPMSVTKPATLAGVVVLLLISAPMLAGPLPVRLKGSAPTV